jgi:hypothetical protein
VEESPCIVCWKRWGHNEYEHDATCSLAWGYGGQEWWMLMGSASGRYLRRGPFLGPSVRTSSMSHRPGMLLVLPPSQASDHQFTQRPQACSHRCPIGKNHAWQLQPFQPLTSRIEHPTFATDQIVHSQGRRPPNPEVSVHTRKSKNQYTRGLKAAVSPRLSTLWAPRASRPWAICCRPKRQGFSMD